MAFLDSNDNNVKVNVVSTADNSGIDQAKAGIDSLGNSSDDASAQTKGFADNFQDGMNKVAVVTGVAGAALTLYANNSVNKLADLVKSSKDLARQTGMSVDQSSELVAAFGRMGISSDNAAVSFRTFAKVIADSQTNTTGTKNKLDELGVAAKNADGSARGFSDILSDVADKFQSLPDGAQKTADAVGLFGRQGTAMLKVLDLGSGGIKDLEDKAKSLGLTLNDQNVGTIANYVKSQKDLADTTGSLQLAVGQLTAPVLTEFNNQMNNVLTTLIGTDSPFRQVTADVLAFGGPILDASAGVLSFLGNIGSAIPVFQAFGKLVGTPIVMPAITVAAAIASILLVYDAVQTVIGAINAMNGASAALKQQDKINQQITDASYAAYKSGDTAKGNKLSSIAANNNTNAPNYFNAAVGAVLDPSQWAKAFGFATGGFTGTGGVNDIAGIVHKGEYVLPQSAVDQSTGMPKIIGGTGGTTNTTSITIQNLNLTTADATRAFFESQDRDSQMASMGLTAARGAM